MHDEQHLCEFIAKEQMIREPFDFVQWRVYFFEDYSPTESVFVFKIHHSVCDHTALMLMLFNLQDSAKMPDIPKLTSRISFF